MTNVRDLCKDISFNRAYNWENIPKGLLGNVAENLDIDEKKVCLFYDSSVLETGRTGLAFCEDGVYWKDIGSPPGYLSWEDFINTKIRRDDFYIYFDDKDKFFVFHRDMELVNELLDSFKTVIKSDMQIGNLIKL